VTATDQRDQRLPQGAQDTQDADLFNRLNEQQPETLRLEPGEVFVGTYVRLEKGHTLEWGEKWIMVLAAPTGELRSLWLLHTVLIDELTKLRPRSGDRIGIKYLGKLKPRSGKGPGYHAYRVASSSEAGRHTWEHVAGEVDEDEVVEPSRFAQPPTGQPTGPHNGASPPPSTARAPASGPPAPAAGPPPGDSEVWALFTGRCEELRIGTGQAWGALRRLGGFMDLRTNDWARAIAAWDMAKWADADRVLTEKFGQT
jgi:hypothetical protein